MEQSTVWLLCSMCAFMSESDESRFNHNCAIEAQVLPCDIKVKVLRAGSYFAAFIQISWTWMSNINVTSDFHKENHWLDHFNQKSATFYWKRIWPLSLTLMTLPVNEGEKRQTGTTTWSVVVAFIFFRFVIPRFAR